VYVLSRCITSQSLPCPRSRYIAALIVRMSPSSSTCSTNIASCMTIPVLSQTKRFTIECIRRRRQQNLKTVSHIQPYRTKIPQLKALWIHVLGIFYWSFAFVNKQQNKLSPCLWIAIINTVKSNQNSNMLSNQQVLDILYMYF
jgi:hypothetical protein